MRESNTELGARLRIAMKNAGLTQTALAQRVGVSQSNIAFILSGRNKSTKSDILANIASVLGVSAAWLLGQSGNCEPVDHAPHNLIPFCSNIPRFNGENVYFDQIDIPPKSYPESFFLENHVSPTSCKIFAVDTDSMSPVLSVGDYAVVNTADTDPWQHPIGHVYALVANEALRYYRLTPALDSIIVSTASPAIAPKEYERADFLSKFHVTGRVIDRFGNGGL